MSAYNYQPPVDKLLTWGDPRKTRDRWPASSAYDVGPEHIPELIRMATDEALHTARSDSQEVWAPIHAWRALGQLRAESAVEPLVSLMHRIDDDDDEWAQEDFPHVFGMIGPAAIPALGAYLADSSRGLWARVTAALSLATIGQQHPDSRAKCVAALMQQLEHFEDNDRTLNAEVIAALLDLKAVEAAPIMERAFAARRVELAVAGDWEDVQIELGLGQTRATPKPNYLEDALGPELAAKLAELSQLISSSQPQSRPKRRKAQKRDKRKQQEPRSQRHGKSKK